MKIHEVLDTTEFQTADELAHWILSLPKDNVRYIYVDQSENVAVELNIAKHVTEQLSDGSLAENVVLSEGTL